MGFALVQWRKFKAFEIYLPITTAIILEVTTLILFSAMHKNENHQVHNLLGAKLDQVLFDLNYHINNQIRSLDHFAKRWEDNQGMQYDNWQKDAENYTKDFKVYQAIQWIDKDLIIRWSQPLIGNEVVIGKSSAFDEKRLSALQKAIELDQIMITEPINLMQGGKGFLVYCPSLYSRNF